MESRVPLYALWTSFSSNPSSPPSVRSLFFPIDDEEDVVEDDGLHSSAISFLLSTGDSNKDATHPILPLLQLLWSTAIDIILDNKILFLVSVAWKQRMFFLLVFCLLFKENFGLNKEREYVVECWFQLYIEWNIN